MFDNLVQSAIFPAILELIDATEEGLVGVRTRLTTQAASPDRLNVMVAQAQLDMLSVWEPMLRDIKAHLDQSHERVHGSPLPNRRDR